MNSMLYPWQQPQWQSLVEAAQSRRLPHALLLTGCKGLGKADFAIHLAHWLLCLEKAPEATLPDEKSPVAACGQCQSCRLFAAQTHPDLLMISAEDSNVIKVEQIRAMVEKNSLTSHISSTKIYMLFDAHKMNTAAANSLLKTLEEPSPNSLLILVTNQPQYLPPTIRSRCQQLRFAVPDNQTALNWLKTQAPETPVEQLLNLSQGAPLLALELEKQQLTQLYENVFREFGRVVFGKSDPVKVADSWHKQNLHLLFDWLTTWVIDAIRLKYDPTGKLISCQEKKAALAKISQAFSLDRLFSIYRHQLRIKPMLDRPVNKPLLLEGFLVDCISV